MAKIKGAGISSDAGIEFEDYTDEVKLAIREKIIEFLYEAAGEITSLIQRASAVGRVSGGKTKGSWRYKVNEKKLTATIGSPLINAVWEEFGTGEYALEGKGRKGKWYIPIGNGRGEISQAVVDAYNMKVVYGSKGKRFVETTGKKPKRTFTKVFEGNREAIEARLESILKGLN